MNPSLQAMLMQILALSNDQVNALPPTERATVMALVRLLRINIRQTTNP